MRTAPLRILVLVGALFALAGCTSPEPEAAPASPAPAETATAREDDCDRALQTVADTRPVLADALTYGSEAGNTDPVDSKIAPLVDNLNALAETAEDPQVSAATQQVAETVDAMRISMNNITVSRLAAQSAQAIAVLEGTPETAQAATDAVTALAAQIRQSADEMTVHGEDFTTRVEALKALCA